MTQSGAPHSQTTSTVMPRQDNPNITRCAQGPVSRERVEERKSEVKRKLRERAVPASSMGRVFGFARLGAGLVYGSMSDSVSRVSAATKLVGPWWVQQTSEGSVQMRLCAQQTRPGHQIQFLMLGPQLHVQLSVQGECSQHLKFTTFSAPASCWANKQDQNQLLWLGPWSASGSVSRVACSKEVRAHNSQCNRFRPCPSR